MVNFSRKLVIHTKFILVEQSQVNVQAELDNKIILISMNKKLDKAKGL